LIYNADIVSIEAIKIVSQPILDLQTLIAEVKKGLCPKYLFFWGHQPGAPGQIDKACLSQWWPSSFSVEGVVYSTAEHYMMAEKARLFGDNSTREKILSAGHPRAAKQLGRGVRDFDEEIWGQYRYAIVVRGNEAKFTQNAALKSFLLNTKKRILVEASPVDHIWGIGLAADDPQAENPETWKGLNLLGFALMQVRTRLQKEE
jgi:ribA/ribD-fused uncharacterized protein